MEALTTQEKIRDTILAKDPSARLTSGGKEISLRCKECGDSINPRSAHMGIKLGLDDSPLIYNCFKCHASGIITYEKLLKWGIYGDTDTMIELIGYNKRVLSMPKNRIFKDNEIYYLNNKFISEGRLSEVKLKYINNRLGINLSYEDLLKNKIVLNLWDLLNSNNINEYTRHVNIINQLNDSFVGFISQDNAFVNMRNLTPGKVDRSIDKRYINYSMFNKYDNSQKYFTIPASINMYNPRRIKLRISEGPFDILSVKYNLVKEEEHTIYSAITGSGYFNICQHFINTMKLINIEVHIYIDADIKDHIVFELANMLSVFQIPFYLHRNLCPGEKDFGVKINRIKEQIQRIV